MAPGKTRSIFCSARNFFQFTMPGPAWWQVVPRWHEHWNSNKVYDGDMVVLQGPEMIFLSKSMEGSDDVNKQCTKLTFTPTQAYRFVLAFRNWLRQHSQQPSPSTLLSKREMLDRFEQHTLKCSSCSIPDVAKVSHWHNRCILCNCWIPSDLRSRIILAGLALVSAALAYAVHELQKNFVFVEYVHAEID